MKYLIVSATALEIKPFLDYLKVDNIGEGELTTFHNNKLELSVFITGVGMMATAFHLGWVLSQGKFDGVINLGIAGAFDRNLVLGELVFVNRQQYGDLGATSFNNFEDVFDLNLAKKDFPPFKSGKIYNNHSKIIKDMSIKKVRAVSVNDVSGSLKQIKRIQDKYNPQIEVMEGIAVHYACKQFGVDYEEIRTISNYVEVRDQSKWKIQLAIENLNNFIINWMISQY